MSQIKRQYSFSRTSDEQIKKFRSKFYINNLSLILKFDLGSTCLEDLSNELFYEIFDYLDGCHIHQSFFNLNNRFQHLLTDSLLPLKINFPSKSNSTVEHRCRHVIIPNKHRIISLHLHEHSLIRSFFDHCTIDSSFTRLQSVILNGISAFKLMTILFYLNCLPQLSSLNILLEEDYYYNLSDIYRLIFRLSSLKYSKVSVSDCEESDVFIPMSINEKPSPIEHLVINFACTVKEITSLLQHTPHLRRLTCERLVETDETYEKEAPLTLSHLTNVTIDDCEIGFDEFEMFIKKISSELGLLRLKTSSPSYLDPKRWKHLIKKHIPHLHEFHFDCHVNAEFLVDITPDPETIIQFTSLFWMERNWFFEFKDTVDEFGYSIHPPKKMWFDDPEYQYRTMQQYSSKSIDIPDRATTQSILLTIEDYTIDTWDPSYTDDMKPCFTAVQFTHLSIDCKGLPIGTLIEIIRLLPNLLTLEVSNSPVLQTDGVSFEDSEMLLLVSITNKITKVKLTKMDSLDQINFLFNLCPRIEYLEVGCTTETDLEKLIGCISLKNNTCVLYLCCLCLCVPDTNEKTIQTLHKIIDFERLFQMESKTFHDYSIQDRQKKIFLNWKLP